MAKKVTCYARNGKYIHKINGTPFNFDFINGSIKVFKNGKIVKIQSEEQKVMDCFVKNSQLDQVFLWLSDPAFPLINLPTDILMKGQPHKHLINGIRDVRKALKKFDPSRYTKVNSKFVEHTTVHFVSDLPIPMSAIVHVNEEDISLYLGSIWPGVYRSFNKFIASNKLLYNYIKTTDYIMPLSRQGAFFVVLVVTIKQVYEIHPTLHLISAKTHHDWNYLVPNEELICKTSPTKGETYGIKRTIYT